jgi:hypothetical protein
MEWRFFKALDIVLEVAGFKKLVFQHGSANLAG